jgi:hypothetical protein
MKKGFRKLMVLTIVISIAVGLYIDSWIYPIAIISLSVFGLLASVGQGSGKRSSKDSAIYGTNLASHSLTDCSDGGGSGGGDC